jgi:hypothetical protein
MEFSRYARASLARRKAGRSRSLKTQQRENAEVDVLLGELGIRTVDVWPEAEPRSDRRRNDRHRRAERLPE